MFTVSYKQEKKNVILSSLFIHSSILFEESFDSKWSRGAKQLLIFPVLLHSNIQESSLDFYFCLTQQKQLFRDPSKEAIYVVEIMQNISINHLGNGSVFISQHRWPSNMLKYFIKVLKNLYSCTENMSGKYFSSYKHSLKCGFGESIYHIFMWNMQRI